MPPPSTCADCCRIRFFASVIRLCGTSRLLLRFPLVLAPAMQTDLAGGRETNVAWTLEEIVRIGTCVPEGRAKLQLLIHGPGADAGDGNRESPYTLNGDGRGGSKDAVAIVRCWKRIRVASQPIR